MFHVSHLVLSIQIIGFSHLLQPPLTALLARDLELVGDFKSLPTLSAAVAENMGFASVALPTTLGLVLAAFAGTVGVPGPAQVLAIVLGVFWSWRYYRQLRVLGPLMRPTSRYWHWALCTIFLTQGPLLLVIVALLHSAG